MYLDSCSVRTMRWWVNVVLSHWKGSNVLCSNRGLIEAVYNFQFVENAVANVTLKKRHRDINLPEVLLEKVSYSFKKTKKILGLGLSLLLPSISFLCLGLLEFLLLYNIVSPFSSSYHYLYNQWGLGMGINESFKFHGLPESWKFNVLPEPFMFPLYSKSYESLLFLQEK